MGSHATGPRVGETQARFESVEMLHLRYFVAVAEELNFSAAARRLHMAASPLSQRIRDLENELGQRLFDRDTHHVTLTPAGAALLPIASNILQQVNSIPWQLRKANRSQRCTVSIGMPAGVHLDLRTRVSMLAERIHESFELRRWPGTTPSLVTAVLEGKLALTLARLPVNDPMLDCLPVMSEQLGALVPADRFAGRDAVALADLTDLACVALPSELTPAYFDQLDRELSDHGIKKRIKLTDTGYAGIAEVISSGTSFSVSMLDAKSPMHGYQLENTMLLPFADFRPRLDTGLFWLRDRASGGDLDQLIDAAREVFADPLSC
ncbi:LysR family transcriptional regulator [Krasilnikovia sp. MM14-A1259]